VLVTVVKNFIRVFKNIQKNLYRRRGSGIMSKIFKTKWLNYHDKHNKIPINQSISLSIKQYCSFGFNTLNFSSRVAVESDNGGNRT
jgi:hypothetical protein